MIDILHIMSKSKSCKSNITNIILTSSHMRIEDEVWKLHHHHLLPLDLLKTYSPHQKNPKSKRPRDLALESNPTTEHLPNVATLRFGGFFERPLAMEKWREDVFFLQIWLDILVKWNLVVKLVVVFYSDITEFDEKDVVQSPTSWNFAG